MKTEILSTWRMLDPLENEWNQLLRSTAANSVFLTWEWIQAWREVVGENQQLFVVTVRDAQGQLVGIAPFHKYSMRFLGVMNFTALRTLADYSTASEYPDWIVKTGVEKEVLAKIIAVLLSASKHWDLIWMPRMAGWTGAYERIVNSTKQAGMLLHARPSVFSNFALPKSLQEFEQGFSAKRRQQLRRNKRNLLSLPGISVEACSDHTDLESYIEALFDLHHRRRMLLGDSGCFIRRPAEAAFYRNFLPKALDRGWLRLFALKQDNVIKAIQVGYAYNGEFLQMQEGFDPDFVNGAGNVLRHVVIEKCIDEGLQNYDNLGGFTEHKRRWGARERNGYSVLIGCPSLKNRLLFRREIWPAGKYLREIGLYDGNG